MNGNEAGRLLAALWLATLLAALEAFAQVTNLTLREALDHLEVALLTRERQEAAR